MSCRLLVDFSPPSEGMPNHREHEGVFQGPPVPPGPSWEQLRFGELMDFISSELSCVDAIQFNQITCHGSASGLKQKGVQVMHSQAVIITVY